MLIGRKKLWKKLAIALLVLLVILLFYIDSVPPAASTIGTMTGLTRRIAIYLEDHNSVPRNISDLPKYKENNSVRDGWFRKIEYIDQGEGIHMLRSYGRNGKSGGAGKNADITMRFKVDAGEVDYEIVKIGSKVVHEYHWKKNREFLESDKE